MEERIKTLLDQTNLNWNVRTESIQTESGITIKDKIALVREDTNDIVGVHSDGYRPFQNQELFELLDKVSNMTGLELTKGGCFKEGRRVYVQMKSADLRLGTDLIKGYLTGINSFDGSTSLAFGPSNVTISCMNSFFAAFKQLNTKVRHTKNMVIRIDEICKGLEGVLEQEQVMFGDIKRMADTRFDDVIKESVTRQLFGIKPEVDVYGSLLTKYYKTGEIDMNEVHPYISEGFGEDFVPQNYDMSVIDKFIQVTDKDGAVMARRIAKEEGLFCGYSAGSCLQGLQLLKTELKPTDVVVCIFHDHGSRYVGKIYNDEWMMERGFLDVKTFKDIVSGRAGQKLITVSPDHLIAEAVALMKKYDIEHIPVMDAHEIVGSLSENGLFQQIFTNPDIKNQSVQSVMEPSYPVVDFLTPVEKLGTLINQKNGAVIAKDEKGDHHIVTKYDVIQSLTK